jgi:hypothetical protein
MNQTHGYSRRGFTNQRAIYAAWKQMKWTAKQRGLEVAKQWLSFDAFLASVGERPSPQHRFRRLTRLAGYNPGNARWELTKQAMRELAEQAQNVGNVLQVDRPPTEGVVEVGIG